MYRKTTTSNISSISGGGGRLRLAGDLESGRSLAKLSAARMSGQAKGSWQGEFAKLPGHISSSYDMYDGLRKTASRYWWRAPPCDPGQYRVYGSYLRGRVQDPILPHARLGSLKSGISAHGVGCALDPGTLEGAKEGRPERRLMPSIDMKRLASGAVLCFVINR